MATAWYADIKAMAVSGAIGDLHGGVYRTAIKQDILPNYISRMLTAQECACRSKFFDCSVTACGYCGAAQRFRLLHADPLVFGNAGVKRNRAIRRVNAGLKIVDGHSPGGHLARGSGNISR